MMELHSLEPKILLIGSRHFQRKMDAAIFQKSGIKFIFQQAHQDIATILNKKSVNFFIIEYQSLDDYLKTLLSKLRYFYPHAGLLLTLQQDNEESRILALQMGVDDCFQANISPEELQAKIHALHRRLCLSAYNEKNIYYLQGYSIDIHNREVKDTENKKIKNLTSGEFSLLKIFLEHPNKLLTRHFLLNKATKYNECSCSRTIDIRISRLRKKIKLDNFIKTVYGEGYIFNC